jgi:ADP-ribosylation factor GTPase-activating protein 1
MYYKPLNDLNSTSKTTFSMINNFKLKDENIDNYCFDCGRKNPEFISINNGIFICKKCAMEHMLLPGGTSILIKNDIKLLAENEILFLEFGGNKKLYEFILNKCPSLINLPRKYLYYSPFISYYQNQLQQLVNEKNKRTKSKKELFQNKLYNLQINSDYSSKEIQFPSEITAKINSSFKRFNTHNSFNYNNNNNICEDNISSLNNKKKKYKNLTNCKLDDEIYNYVFTQRTNNTHANTVSNSNTLTYVSEKTIENNNNENLINQKNKSKLKGSNIVYNKPKLGNNYLKTDNILKIKNYNFNSISNFDNENFYNTNINYKNITIDHINVFKYNKTPLNKSSTIDYSILNLNIENNRYNYTNYTNKLNNKSLFKKNVSTISQEDDKILNSDNKMQNFNHRNSVHCSRRNKCFFNKIENKNEELEHKNVNENNERKIKEIIINKKINNCKDNFNYSHYKSRTLSENLKPILVNLNLHNLQNTYEKSKKEIKSINDYFSNEMKNNNIDKDDNSNLKNKMKTLDLKDSTTYGINTINSKSLKTFKRKIQKFHTNNTIHNHFNIKKNLKKKFQEIENEKNIITISDSFENSNKTKNNNEIKNDNSNICKPDNGTINKDKDKDKENNNVNNKKKYAVKTTKMIYFKNKNNINNNETIHNYKIKIIKDKSNKSKDYIKIKNDDNSYKKDNVEQFQLLPNKEPNKVADKKIVNKVYLIKKDKKNINNKKDYCEKKKNSNESIINKKEKKINKRNIISENQNESKKKIFYNSTNDLNFGETFKNSIRNKYKRERSQKK